PRTTPAPPHLPPRPPACDQLSKDVADLKRELEGMRRTLTRSVLPPAQWAGSLPEAWEAYAILPAADVSPELARDIVESSESRTSHAPSSSRRPADPAAF